MKTASTVAFRVCVVFVCVFATWKSVWIARVDWLANAGTADALKGAIRLDPDNGDLAAIEAIYKSNNGESSALEDLRRAARMDPFDSGVFMTIGLQEEFRGNLPQAEHYLVHATEIDRQFKPAWTLANFYYRTDQPDKMWPLIKHCLDLDPMLFDKAPVFDLCWRQTSDSKKIRALMPRRGSVLVEYLSYLVGTKRPDAAIEVWPEALATADPTLRSDVEALTGYPEYLIRINRAADAVRGWNDLVARKIIASGRLDPKASAFLADPDFHFPIMEKAFGWHVAHQTGAYVSQSGESIRFEFDGTEPEAFHLLSTFAPVMPGRTYRLKWTSDGARLGSPEDSGFAFQVVRQPENVVTICQPMLSLHASDGCDFSVPTEDQDVRIDLIYKRALGTTRAEGVLRISGIRLELGS